MSDSSKSPDFSADASAHPKYATYTVGTRTSFSGGMANQMTVGVSNSAFLGGQNNLSVGITTNLSLGPSFSGAFLGPAVTWSTSPTVSLASAPSTSVQESTTTRAEKSIELKAGVSDSDRKVWQTSASTLLGVKAAIGVLAGMNAAVAAAGVVSAGNNQPTELGVKRPAEYETLVDIGLAGATAVASLTLIQQLIGELSTLYSKMTQVAKLTLNQDQAALEGDFTTLVPPRLNTSTLSLASQAAVLRRIAGGNVTAALSSLALGDQGATVAFHSGRPAELAGKFNAANTAALSLTKASATLGAFLGDTSVDLQRGTKTNLSGPSLRVMDGPASIKADVGATATGTSSLELKAESVFATVSSSEAESVLTLNTADAGITFRRGTIKQGLGIDQSGVWITGPATTKFEATATGINLGGDLIKLG
ncbi:hypothetical protein SAMN05216551_102260 [Chitinasiproducens palmae]|uniref:Uncharacterized protein n=2 Tax=Chitinasiproducens palmae TaxID=1770053 RepID=A0A1H2PKX4_9BURK|nr:hypothetical protein SAMN05216551_102260 [Chitinasiproducens palmae]